MLLNGGTLDGTRLLAPETVALMTRNHLPQAIIPIGVVGLQMPNNGFGLGFSVVVDEQPTQPDAHGFWWNAGGAPPIGSYWWVGAYQTYFWVDPAHEIIGLLMTQSPDLIPYAYKQEFHTMVYEAFNEEDEKEVSPMKKIIHFLNINAPAGNVYRALTTTEGLSGWWSKQVQVQPGVGGLIDFRFVDDFNPDMEVTALQEDRLVAWKCVGGHDNWQDNTFSFDLRASGTSTEVMFVQVYAQELSDEVYGTYNFNWGYYLGSLKQLCETGTGAPYTPG